MKRPFVPLVVLGLLHAAFAYASEDGPNPRIPLDINERPPYSIMPAKKASTQTEAESRTGEWLVAPIPGYSPSQGANIKLITGYIYAPDSGASPNTPNDLIGVGAFYSEKHSEAAAAAYSGSLANDMWRTLLAGGNGILNYDFFGIGSDSASRDQSIPIEQKMTFGLAQLLRRVNSDLFFGVRLQLLDIHASTSVTIPGGPALPDDELAMDVNSLGPSLQWDSRDNQFFPTRGILANIKVDFFSRELGSDVSFEVYDAAYNQYWVVPWSNGIIAVRGRVRSTSGDVPFFALSQFGQDSDLRGYVDGQYRDKTLVAAQSEYRQNFFKNWGYVIFGGAGYVAPHITDVEMDDLLWSVGTGLRYRLTQKNPVNLRFDVAYGKEDTAWYLTVGEAF